MITTEPPQTTDDFINDLAAAITQYDTPYSVGLLWFLTDLNYPSPQKEMEHLENVLESALGDKEQYSTGRFIVKRAQPDPKPICDLFKGKRFTFHLVEEPAK